jgi:thiamine-phosphate pyrophosphorylase
MSDAKKIDRCRLVLIAPPSRDPEAFAAQLGQALSGGDVASVILAAQGADEVLFQALAEAAVPVIQQAGAAALVADDSRVMGRTGADGLHVEARLADLAGAVERLSPRLIVGAGGFTNRDQALDAGELRPDYVMFGLIGADTHPEPHARNLKLGRWWAEMIQVPCIVQAGGELESIAEAAATGAEFVAAGRAVFDAPDPAAAVARANALLDENAPRSEE